MNQRLISRGKILSFTILLSAIILFGFFSMKVEADSNNQYEDSVVNDTNNVSPQADLNSIFTFTPISDTECDVRLTDKTATKAIIPEKIELDGKEYKVTGIAGNGFTSASKLELVRLPKSVKTIGANAFANCKALTSLTLPAVEIIGANAFAMTKMEYLIIPTSVTSVASTILRGANTKVYVRSALEEGTTVPEGWVSNWNGSNKNQDVEFDSDFIPEVKYELVSTEIQTFALGDDVEERNGGYYVSGYQEFCTIDSDDYKEVYIPATYTGTDGIERPIIGIASGAFYFNDINKVTIGYSENPIILETDSFFGLNGNVITINRGVLLESESMVSDGEQSQVVISENVFSNSTVSTIILPNTLTAIGNNMFDGCENLRDIHFIEPDGTLSSLAEANIILNLISTQKVILPDTMTYIGASAFALTHNILELYIPNSVSIVGKDIINSWKSNQTVYVDFERSNSVFDTWDKDWAYGSGTENTAKIVYKLSDTKYTITYNIDTQYHNNPNEYISDQGLDLKPVIKTGYTFEGWYLDENFENPVENIAVGTTGNLTLYAKLTPNSYNIKYDKNTPELASNPILGEMDESNHTYNVESLLSANKYTLKGWTFIGWNTKADGTGDSYEDLAPVTTLADSGVKLLYAQWTQKEYKIEYLGNRPNNATSILEGNMNPETHLFEEKFNLKKVAYQLNGWTFTDWNTKEDGTGITYLDEEIVSGLTETNIKLYAQWEVTTYIVEYEKNQPSNTEFIVNGVMEPSKHIYDVSSFLRTNAFELEGYTFVGWNTKADGSGNAFTNGAAIESLTSNGSIKLYAQWQANTYTIQYKPNRPNSSELVIGETASSSHRVDEEGTLSINGFTLKGWTFKGWNTKTDGSGISYSNKENVKNVITSASSIELYAQWEAKTFAIKYEGNVPRLASEEVNGIMDNSNYTVDSTGVLAENKYTLKGWTFTGWNIKADGTGTSYADKSQIKIATDDSTVILYAQWEAKQFSIQYEPNKPLTASKEVIGITRDSIHSDKEYKELVENCYTLVGWTFTGWNTKADGSGTSYADKAQVKIATDDSIIVLYAQWQAKSYVIEYRQNKPSIASSAVIGETSNSNHIIDTEKSLTPNEFKLQGWNFVGWNTKADGTGTPYTDKAQVKIATNDSIVILYAQWQVNTFIIEYRQNKPANASKLVTGETASSHHTSDELGRLTSNGFKLQGWTFIGWNTKADGSGIAYSNNYNIKLALDSSSLLLYAQWSANTYTIEYKFNKPTNASTPINDKMTISQLKVDTVSKLANNSFEIKGWTFTGWNTKADGSGTSYANGYSTNFTYEKNAIVSLYAQWRANTYTIKYNSGQGTGTMNSTTHYYDSPAPLGECTFIYLGRTIKRWNTKVDGSGISYSKDDMVKNLTSNDGEVVNLYAQWETNDYKVVYFSNKPTNASHNVLGQMVNSTHKVDTYSPLSKNTFTLKGWTFIGWNTKADGTGDSYTDQQNVVNLTYQEDGEVQLYAQWRAHTYTIKYVNTPPKNNTGFTNEYTLPETTTHVYDTPSPINGAYTLVSWIMISWNYNGRNLNPNQKVTDLTDVDEGVITVYAQWAAKNVHECLNSDGVYEIATENQLRGISTSFNYSYKLICDLNVGDWTPISTFYGELYLGDYKITYKNTSLETNKSYGFILRNYGKISGGKFYPSITQKTVVSSQTTNVAVGGVVAYNYGSLNSVYVMSTFGQNNSYVTGGYARVDIDVRSNNCVVGGVAGYNYGYISSCRNEASIAGSHYIGGIVGSNEDHAEIYVSTNYGTLWFCLLATGNKFVGGIAGQNWDNTTMMHNNNYGELRFACKSSNNSSIVYMGKLTGWCHRGGTLEFNHGYGKVTYDTSYSENVVTLGEFGKISNSPNYDY